MAKVILGHKIIFIYNIVLILHEVIKDMNDVITIWQCPTKKKKKKRTNIKFFLEGYLPTYLIKTTIVDFS